MVPQFSTLLGARCLAGLACSLAASVSAADCGPVVAAFEKAGKQQRIATYEVEGPNATPVLGPGAVIRIGKSMWVDAGNGGLDRYDVDFPDLAMAQMIREAERSGKTRCEAAGSGSYRGAAVTKYRYQNPRAARLPDEVLKRLKTTQQDLARVTLWVDTSTGLPAYQEVYAPGPKGNAWVYGDAVKAPGGRSGK